VRDVPANLLSLTDGPFGFLLPGGAKALAEELDGRVRSAEALLDKAP
jgi:hypothetical protein